MRRERKYIAISRRSLQACNYIGHLLVQVAITSDFQKLNVMYVCKTKPRPPELDEILVDAGFSLRHELSQLKLMGEVPMIYFVEDKTLKRLAEVEERLAVADKGSEDDIDPTSDLDRIQEEDLDAFNLFQQVYGLNHSKLFDKIMAAKSASSVHKPKTDVSIVQEGVPCLSSEGSPRLQKENPKHTISTYLKEIKAECRE